MKQNNTIEAQPERITKAFLWKFSVLFFILITGAFLQQSVKESAVNHPFSHQAQFEISKQGASENNASKQVMYLQKSIGEQNSH